MPLDFQMFLPPSVAWVYLPLLAEQRDGEEEPSALFRMKPLPFLLSITEPIESQMCSFFKQMQLLTILTDAPIVSAQPPSRSTSQTTKKKQKKRPSCVYINASQFTNAGHLLGF